MKRPIAITPLLTFAGWLLAAATSVASDGFPPKNLPDGSGWLPGPNVTVGAPGLPVRAHERPKLHPGPYGRYGARAGGERLGATPIQLPAPRSIGNSRMARPIFRGRPDAAIFPQIYTPPRPYATPIQLP